MAEPMTNYEMKVAQGEQLAVAETQLQSVLTDLESELSSLEIEALRQVQSQWRAYRDGLRNFAMRRYDGGTNASLAGIAAALQETRRRTNELLQEISDRTIERRP